MNDKEKRVLGWFEKADQDLLTAEVILNLAVPMPGIVCFHIQQCVEKYLKGLLVFHGLKARRTHDLVRLLNECSDIDFSFTRWEEACIQLTVYAVETRYPTYSYEYSVAEAEEAVAFAAQIKDFVRSKVKLGEK
ncbi:HEPN domain-containing protein [Candidatus Poribacteria bacterium]